MWQPNYTIEGNELENLLEGWKSSFQNITPWFGGGGEGGKGYGLSFMDRFFRIRQRGNLLVL